MHYHFVTSEVCVPKFHTSAYSKKYPLQAMQRGITAGLFIEHAQVHSNIYGTSLESVNSIHKTGSVCVLDVDIKGMKQLKASHFPAKYVFILPPSLEILETRLRARGTETEEQLQIRLGNAKEEIEFGSASDNFDQVLVNDDCNVCFDSLVGHLLEWFPETK